MKTNKIDLHVHTCASHDALTRPADVVRWAQRRGIGVAITDHNTTEVARHLRDTAPIPVIVGEEIRTTCGEIIGLFLARTIPPDLSPQETIARIRDQGGIVYLPHPLDRVRRHSALDHATLQEIVEQIDAVEVLNARVTFAADNCRAADLARAHGLLCGAGSDAHMGCEIGRAYVELPDSLDKALSDRTRFLASLSMGQVRGRISPPWVHLGSRYAHWSKTMRRASGKSCG
jgi:predicted metal-dependent phosphoesterase TrpH